MSAESWALEGHASRLGSRNPGLPLGLLQAESPQESERLEPGLVSERPRRASDIMASRPGRLAFVPEIRSVYS